MAVVIVLQGNQIVIHHVCNSRVHIAVHRNVKGVTALIGVHDVGLVVETY